MTDKRIAWGKLSDHGIEAADGRDGLAAAVGIALVSIQSHGDHWDVGFSLKIKGPLPLIEGLALAVAKAINWLAAGYSLKRVKPK